MVRWAGLVAEISLFPTEISANGLKIFPYEHSISVTGTKRFCKIASLSKRSGQNGIILPSMHFYFGSVRFTFVS